MYFVLCTCHSYNAYKYIHVPGRLNGLYAEKVQNTLDIYITLFITLFGLSNLDYGIYLVFYFQLKFNHENMAL